MDDPRWVREVFEDLFGKKWGSRLSRPFLLLAILALTATFIGIIWTFGSQAYRVAKQEGPPPHSATVPAVSSAKLSPQSPPSIASAQTASNEPAPTPRPRSQDQCPHVNATGSTFVGRYGAVIEGNCGTFKGNTFEGTTAGALIPGNKGTFENNHFKQLPTPPAASKQSNGGGNVSVGHDLNGNVCTSGANCTFNYLAPPPPKAEIAEIAHIQKDGEANYLIDVTIALDTAGPLNQFIVATPALGVLRCGADGFSMSAPGLVSSRRSGDLCYTRTSSAAKGRYSLWMRVDSESKRPPIGVKLNDADFIELKYPPAAPLLPSAQPNAPAGK